MSNRIGLLPVSAERLRELLDLPTTTTILEVFTDQHRVSGEFLFKIQDDSLAELGTGDFIPRLNAEFERVMIEARPKFKTYF